MINIFWIFQAYNQWGKLKEVFCQELFICSEYHIPAIQDAHSAAHVLASVTGAFMPVTYHCIHTGTSIPLHSASHWVILQKNLWKDLLFYYKLLLMFPSITVKAFIWLLKLRVSRLCFLSVSSQDRRENITEIFMIQWERWIWEGWPPLLMHTRACRVLMEVADLLPNNQNHRPSGGELPSN